MPVFAVLALHAQWLRVARYGWSTDRFWAGRIALVLRGGTDGQQEHDYRQALMAMGLPSICSNRATERISAAPPAKCPEPAARIRRLAGK